MGKFGEKFNFSVDKKEFTLELTKDGIYVGEVTGIFENDGYWWFKNWLDETTFNAEFPSTNFCVVSLVYVDKRFRYKGYGKKLMDKFNEIRLAKFPELQFVLQTSPMESAIPIEKLIFFYEYYGFKKFIKLKSKYIMVF